MEKKQKIESKILAILNRNLSIQDEYSIDDVTLAFEGETYNSISNKKQKLIIHFFENFNNHHELIKEIKTTFNIRK